MDLVFVFVVIGVWKLLWYDDDNSYAVTYVCGHVTDDGRCNPASLFINVLRRDDVNTAISPSSLDHMSVALRTACLEPGDLQISDQQGQFSQVHGQYGVNEASGPLGLSNVSLRLFLNCANMSFIFGI